jgi:hypothetical protein
MTEFIWMIKHYDGKFAYIRAAGNSGYVGLSWVPSQEGAVAFPTWATAHRAMRLFRLHDCATVVAELKA